MKALISNIVTFIIAIIGFIGGGIWGYTSNWDMEPVILMSISFIQIVGFILIKIFNGDEQTETSNFSQKIVNKKKVGKQINIQKNEGDITM